MNPKYQVILLDGPLKNMVQEVEDPSLIIHFWEGGMFKTALYTADFTEPIEGHDDTYGATYDGLKEDPITFQEFIARGDLQDVKEQEHPDEAPEEEAS